MVKIINIYWPILLIIIFDYFKPSQDSEFPSARFPDAEFIRQFSKRSVRTAKAPTPQNCIIQMINIQLKVLYQ